VRDVTRAGRLSGRLCAALVLAAVSIAVLAPSAAAQSAPTLTTNASGGGPVGTPVHDVATLTGAEGGPVPTGTVTFTLYGPGDSTCTDPPFFVSSDRPVSAEGTAQSASFTATAAGTYR
jgi:hypothetical protein